MPRVEGSGSQPYTAIRTPSGAGSAPGDMRGSKSKLAVDRRMGNNSREDPRLLRLKRMDFTSLGSRRTDYDQKVQEDELLARDPGV